MAIPFFGMVNFMTFQADFKQIKLSSSYRLELTKQQALSKPRVYIYKRTLGILEKNICRIAYATIIKELTKNNNTEELTYIQNAKLISADKNEITIKYLIQGENTTPTHQLHNDYVLINAYTLFWPLPVC